MSEEICKNCKYHFIEEISFDYPQSCCNKENIIGTTEPFLHCKDFEYSKDYITDLQQENKQLKEEIEEYKRIEQEDLIAFNNYDSILNELKAYILNHHIVGHTILNTTLDDILNKLKELKEKYK